MYSLRSSGNLIRIFITVPFILGLNAIFYFQFQVYQPPPPPQQQKPQISYAACIISATPNFYRRQLTRSLVQTPSHKFDYVFVVAKSHSESIHNKLLREQEEFGDLLVDDQVYENFASQSHKVDRCFNHFLNSTTANIILKFDDDTFVNWKKMLSYLDEIMFHSKQPERIYFGLKAENRPVANPIHFGNKKINTARYFEFQYQGKIWPSFMQGGFYGLGRELAKSVAGHQLYVSEDATMGVAVSSKEHEMVGLNKQLFLYFGKKDHGLDYVAASKENSTLAENVLCALQCSDTCFIALHHAVQTAAGAITSKAVQQCIQTNPVLDHNVMMILGANNSKKKEHCSWHSQQKQRAMQPFQESPPVNLSANGDWWENMKGVFRGQSIFLLGNEPSLNELPLHRLQNSKAIVFDQYYQTQERYRSFKPYFYMSMQPNFCIKSARDISEYTTLPSIFASFFPYSFQDFKFTEAVNAGPLFRYFRKDTGESERNISNNQLFGVESYDSVESSALEILAYLGFSSIYVAAVDIKSNHDSFILARNILKKKYNNTEIYHATIFEAESNDIFPIKPFKNLFPKISYKEDIDLLLREMPLLPEKYVNFNQTNNSLKSFFPYGVFRDACEGWPVVNILICKTEIFSAKHSSLIKYYIPHGPVQGEIILLSRLFNPINTSSVSCFVKDTS